MFVVVARPIKLAAHSPLAIDRYPPTAVQGFEIGSGFSGSRMVGSEHNDAYFMAEGSEVRTRTNR